MGGDRTSPLSVLSLPYLMVVQYVAGLPCSDSSVARQFTLVNANGVGDGEEAVSVLCVSNWHRQRTVSSHPPLLAEQPVVGREM